MTCNVNIFGKICIKISSVFYVKLLTVKTDKQTDKCEVKQSVIPQTVTANIELSVACKIAVSALNQDTHICTHTKKFLLTHLSFKPIQTYCYSPHTHTHPHTYLKQ